MRFPLVSHVVPSSLSVAQKSGSGLRDSCDDDTCQELVDVRCAPEYGEVLNLHGSEAGEIVLSLRKKKKKTGEKLVS